MTDKLMAVSPAPSRSADADEPGPASLEPPVERQRAIRHEDPLPGHPITRPQGHRSDTMGHQMETSPERLRRPDAGRRRKMIMKTATYTVHGTVPPAVDNSDACGPGVAA